MKALLVQETKSYIPTHKLLELAEACVPLDSYYSEPNTIRILKNFDYFDQVGRYGAASNYDPLAIDTQELKTAGVSIWMSSYLDDLDSFVFKTRGNSTLREPNTMTLSSQS